MSRNSRSTIQWWADVKYCTRCNCKGHIRVMISMTKDNIVDFPRIVKLNTEISTKSDLLGIMGLIIWMKYFIKAQEYTIDNSFLYQDNRSTVLLA